MPEIRFRVRWPDGRVQSCYSPSLVVRDFFTAGESYALADFLQRSRAALTIASDRVEAKYGHACTRAAAQLAHIETIAETFTDVPQARVRVDAFDN
jgi:uncharacterized repeat protein (TIGR04042 family)